MRTAMSEKRTPEERADRFRELHAKLRAEVAKVIVGHGESLSHMLQVLQHVGLILEWMKSSNAWKKLTHSPRLRRHAFWASKP